MLRVRNRIRRWHMLPIATANKSAAGVDQRHDPISQGRATAGPIDAAAPELVAKSGRKRGEHDAQSSPPSTLSNRSCRANTPVGFMHGQARWLRQPSSKRCRRRPRPRRRRRCTWAIGAGWARFFSSALPGRTPSRQMLNRTYRRRRDQRRTDQPYAHRGCSPMVFTPRKVRSVAPRCRHPQR